MPRRDCLDGPCTTRIVAELKKCKRRELLELEEEGFLNHCKGAYNLDRFKLRPHALEAYVRATGASASYLLFGTPTPPKPTYTPYDKALLLLLDAMDERDRVRLWQAARMFFPAELLYLPDGSFNERVANLLRREQNISLDVSQVPEYRHLNPKVGVELRRFARQNKLADAIFSPDALYDLSIYTGVSLHWICNLTGVPLFCKTSLGDRIFDLYTLQPPDRQEAFCRMAFVLCRYRQPAQNVMEACGLKFDEHYTRRELFRSSGAEISTENLKLDQFANCSPFWVAEWMSKHRTQIKGPANKRIQACLAMPLPDDIPEHVRDFLDTGLPKISPRIAGFPTPLFPRLAMASVCGRVSVHEMLFNTYEPIRLRGAYAGFVQALALMEEEDAREIEAYLAQNRLVTNDPLYCFRQRVEELLGWEGYTISQLIPAGRYADFVSFLEEVQKPISPCYEENRDLTLHVSQQAGYFLMTACIMLRMPADFFVMQDFSAYATIDGRVLTARERLWLQRYLCATQEAQENAWFVAADKMKIDPEA
ncbi:MAG TPA: hypothetical protein IAC31_05140 [Candidatus Faecousia intestinigallinarum]|nr:hypothetical protein [Candidatus Faecousia intestinigallinarum]